MQIALTLPHAGFRQGQSNHRRTKTQISNDCPCFPGCGCRLWLVSTCPYYRRHLSHPLLAAGHEFWPS